MTLKKSDVRKDIKLILMIKNKKRKKRKGKKERERERGKLFRYCRIK